MRRMKKKDEVEIIKKANREKKEYRQKRRNNE